MEKQYHKITSTALMVANFRAKYTNLPYAKEIYKVASKSTKNNLEKNIRLLSVFARFFPSSLERLSSLEWRYLAVNKGLHQSKPDAIIEIACGLSARGLEFNKKTYIETDLDEVVSLKKNIYAKIKKNSDKDNHSFEALNAVMLDDWKNLGEKHFTNFTKNKVAIVHEGLVAYFSDEEQEQLRDNIAFFLKNYSPSGLWITTDFSPMQTEKSFLVRFAKRLIKNKTKREFNHFKSDKEISSFLKAAGLKVKVIKNPVKINDLTCIKKMSLNPKKVEQSLKHSKLYLISLNNADE